LLAEHPTHPPGNGPRRYRRGPYKLPNPLKRGLCIVAATVLVADDDADIVRFVEIYLRLEGFAVVTARDGPDVLAKAVAVRPDLVLLDVVMPGLDGYAVCARIRADATLAAVPVIMVTANYVSADVAAARRVGADDFLVKPFDPVVLLDKAKALLGRATVSPSLPGTPA
jgi:DNA-binding response OmpR family regulator